MSLTVAVPTWNNPRQLVDTLLSMVRNTGFSGQAIVVNNGEHKLGGKDYYDYVQGQVPYDLDWIDSPGNLGWCGGINSAMKHATGDKFVMLNDDVLFPPAALDWWPNLLNWFKHPDVGGVGPSSNYVSGAQSAFFHIGSPVLQVPYLIGFCAAYRTELLRELGGLDESLPGGDDLDLSLRVQQKGQILIADRRCYLHHHGAQTGQRVFPGQWDSVTHQTETYNALIRKHSLWSWYGLTHTAAIDWPSCTLSTNAVTSTHLAMQSKDESIQGLWAAARTEPSDVNELLDVLMRYASGSRVVVEFGVSDCTTTAAFLKARPLEVHSYDIVRHERVDYVEKIAKQEGQHFEFHLGSTLDVEIPECDLLYIDDWHVYPHVKAELEKHADKALKYIALHDVYMFLEHSEDGSKPGIWQAISEFLRDHDEWRIAYTTEASNGLVILSRIT